MIENKRILITGASTGIGAELALQLASGRNRLALAARQKDKLEAVAARCRESGAETLVLPTDVTDPEQCRLMAERTAEAFGGIDIFVANAGISMWARFEDIGDLSILEKIMKVNYLGAVYPTYYLLPHLRKSRGRIVVVSSLTGKTGVPTRTAYAASKHALHGFFDSLRIELTGSGVGVTLVCPGFVDTGIGYLSPTGEALKQSPRENAADSMSVQECARQILRAAESGKREWIMTAVGRAGAFLRPFLPGLIDRLALKKISGSARERTST